MQPLVVLTQSNFLAFFTFPASPGERQNKEIDSHQYSEQLYTAHTIGHTFVLCMKKIQNCKHPTFRRLAESPFLGQVGKKT
jgi:hypothetical protein